MMSHDTKEIFSGLVKIMLFVSIKIMIKVYGIRYYMQGMLLTIIEFFIRQKVKYL